jgi:HSP20 family protein
MSQQNENVPARRNLWDEVDPFRDIFRVPASSLLSRSLGEFRDRAWAPAVDVTENPNAYVVTVELAGAKRDDIGVECHDGVLTVKGEKKSEREEKEEHRHYVERTYGSFTRSFRMPADAGDEIKANFKDGVLTVEIAKREEKKPKVISIQ